MAAANGSYEREVGFYSVMGTRYSCQGITGEEAETARVLRTPVIYFSEFHPPTGLWILDVPHTCASMLLYFHMCIHMHAQV